MTEAFVAAGAIFAVGGLLWGWIAAADALRWPTWVGLSGALVWAFFVLVSLLALAGAEDATGPCLRHETSLHYNPATKTMAPARHCVERAEWVK